jgi:hypothetical protein
VRANPERSRFSRAERGLGAWLGSPNRLTTIAEFQMRGRPSSLGIVRFSVVVAVRPQSSGSRTPSSLTRKRVTHPFRVAHSQNVNVAAHVRRCSRNPATVHKETTVHLLTCRYPVQPVFRRSPPPSKTQRSRQSNHIAAKSYRVSPVLQRHATDRLPVFSAVINSTHN